MKLIEQVIKKDTKHLLFLDLEGTQFENDAKQICNGNKNKFCVECRDCQDFRNPQTSCTTSEIAWVGQYCKRQAEERCRWFN